MHNRSEIISTGSFLPNNIIYNNELNNVSISLADLIEQKTGVKARRFADDSQSTSDLAILAAKSCLTKVNFDPKKLDGVIVATSSPDRIQPATATRVQYQLGACNAFAFDINSVCSGGVFALTVGDAYIKTGAYKNILIIASEIYSRYLDKTDFSTYPYFGDGAGAILLSRTNNTNKGIICSILKTDGSKADVIQIPAGGTILPYEKLTNPKDIYFKMIGREVLDFAINKGSEIIEEILQITNINKEEIRYIIPHQANINIINQISEKTKISLNKFVINLDKYGNTAAASIFIGFDEILSTNNVKTGEIILLVAFGGGLSWGASLLRV